MNLPLYEITILGVVDAAFHLNALATKGLVKESDPGLVGIVQFEKHGLVVQT